MAGLALCRAQLQQDHHQGKGLSVPSAKYNRARCTVLTRGFRYPAGLYRFCSLPYMRRRMHPHARNPTHPTSAPTQTGNDARAGAHTRTNSHKCTRTRRALTYETMGAAPRWTREQWRSATKASKRRPSTRCKRTARSKSKSEAPLDLAALATLSSSIKSRSSPAGSRWCQ
jgi:hypothetical protein